MNPRPLDVAVVGRRLRGLRNVLLHEYLQPDYSVVAGAVPQAVQVFSDYVGEIAGWTSRQGPA